MKIMRHRPVALMAAAALAFSLAACGDSADDDPTGDVGGDTDIDGDGATDDGDTDDDGAAAPGDAGPITIGIFSGWEEGIAVSHLWQYILEEQGYEVNMETAEAGIVFTGLAQGDYDVNFDTWLPLTHASYLEQYGDDIEELGMWLEDTPLTIAVNDDAPITSLAELADNADLFDNRIVGIEAGAGLTEQTETVAIPTYGLEGMDFMTSSTPAMLAELGAAIEAGDNIAVTLWRPHWAYEAFPIRDLEDPEGAMGEADNIYIYGTSGFGDRFPEVAEWFANFTMTHDQLHELEGIMFFELEGEDNDGAVQQWLEANPDFVDSVIGQ